MDAFATSDHCKKPLERVHSQYAKVKRESATRSKDVSRRQMSDDDSRVEPKRAAEDEVHGTGPGHWFEPLGWIKRGNATFASFAHLPRGAFAMGSDDRSSEALSVSFMMAAGAGRTSFVLDLVRGYQT